MSKTSRRPWGLKAHGGGAAGYRACALLAVAVVPQQSFHLVEVGEDDHVVGVADVAAG